MNAKFIQKGDSIDFIPSRDMDAGEIIQHGNLVGITKTPVKAGELGALAVSGIFAVVKNNGIAFPLGTDVFWNIDINSADRKGLFIGTAVKAVGTEKDSVEVLLNSASNLSKDFTAFEVFATDTEIPAGTVDEVTGLTYTQAVSANMIHRMRIRTSTPVADKANSDVAVDWGDGTTSTLNDAYEIDESDFTGDGEVAYIMRHTYTAVGRYKVVIHGKGYFCIQHEVTGTGDNCVPLENCLCRAFDTDLPVASCVTNLSNFCRGSYKLLKVHVPTKYNWNAPLANCYGLFIDCRNLLTAYGLKDAFSYSLTVKEMFRNDRALTDTDMMLPSLARRKDGYQRVFGNCYDLTADVSKIFPLNGFSERVVDLRDLFKNCAKLTGTVPAKILWENTDKVWTSPSSSFNSASTAVRSQVPTSWGGTMAEPEIVRHTEVVDVLPDSPDANTVYLVKGQ